MNYFFQVIIILGIIINLISCTKKSVIQKHESLTITISTDKELYVKGEPVWVKLIFKNTGTTDYKFFPRF